MSFSSYCYCDFVRVCKETGVKFVRIHKITGSQILGLCKPYLASKANSDVVLVSLPQDLIKMLRNPTHTDNCRQICLVAQLQSVCCCCLSHFALLCCTAIVIVALFHIFEYILFLFLIFLFFLLNLPPADQFKWPYQA